MSTDSLSIAFWIVWLERLLKSETYSSIFLERNTFLIASKRISCSGSSERSVPFPMLSRAISKKVPLDRFYSYLISRSRAIKGLLIR